MFGSKKSNVARVPVFTIQDVPYKYEPISTVFSVEAKQKLIDELGELGANVGADAVIAITHQFTSEYWYVTYGTAIRYLRDHRGNLILK